MSYSINHNHAKIEIDNIVVTPTHIAINATFYFEQGFVTSFAVSYTHVNFDQTVAINELKAAWNAANAKKQYELAFRSSKPAAAYIDTPDPEFP